MIGAGISITEERAKKVLFSESYYSGGIAAIVKEGMLTGQTDPDGLMHGVDDIKYKRIGVILGSVHDSWVNKTYPEAEVSQYQNVPDMLIALKTGKVDVAWYDHTGLREVLASNAEIAILAEKVFYCDIAAGFNETNDRLREQFNTFLREIKSNGVYDDIFNRWMNQGIIDMPEIQFSGIDGVLKVGVVNDLGIPSSFIKDGKLAGFDIEIASRFAAWLGKKFDPVPYHFNGLIAAVSTKKIDVIIASMMITGEREKQIDFSDPYYATGASVIALKKNISGYAGESGIVYREKNAFLKDLFSSFHSNLLHENRYLLILDGLKVTLIITIFSALLGTILGGLICSMRMSKRKILSGGAGTFITLIRGIPVLVLLMIIFYIVFASVNIDPVLVAIVAFGINFGAYVSEMFRTSIESVDKGQREAGIASGFTKTQTFFYIITPQALRTVLPVYKGEFISMMKMTSIVGYIAVQDLTKASDIIRSRTFDAFFPLLMAAVIYLLIAWLLTWALGHVEISVDPKRKRIKKIKEVAG
jgi:polar amino acid transport system substrate-binding protein